MITRTDWYQARIRALALNPADVDFDALVDIDVLTKPYVILPEQKLKQLIANDPSAQGTSVRLLKHGSGYNVARTLPSPRAAIELPIHRTFEVAAPILLREAMSIPWKELHATASAYENRLEPETGYTDTHTAPDLPTYSSLRELPVHRAYPWFARLRRWRSHEDFWTLFNESRRCYAVRLSTSAALPMAFLGEDGRYHLYNTKQGQVTCNAPALSHLSLTGAPVPHDDDDDACTDLAQLSITVPREGALLDPALVPRELRCNTSQWPLPRTVRTSIGRLRQKLVDLQGPACAICTCRYGSIIDHDHLTGLVRGLLCGGCNSLVESPCRHIGGCVTSEYLNYPPAQALRRTYPDAARRVDVPVLELYRSYGPGHAVYDKYERVHLQVTERRPAHIPQTAGSLNVDSLSD